MCGDDALISLLGGLLATERGAPDTPGEKTMEPLDWNALRENCAGDESLVQEVLELFRKESDGLLNDVRVAVAAKETVAVRKTAHRLKGALVSLGAAPSVAAAKDLEHQGSQGDATKFDETFALLEKEMARLMTAISVAHAA
jgi:HPt (histidine-containing phosphotransfer) domain-containing protein